MHAFSLALVALFAASAVVLAAPAPDTHPVLKRRAPPLLAVAALGWVGTSIGLGAAAVHKNKDNGKILQSIDEEVHLVRSELAATRGTQHAAHTLRRRQIGTTTSSVALHRIRKLRKRMDELDHEIDQLEHDANACLAAEGLHEDPVEHDEAKEEGEVREELDEEGESARRLERRQLGMILGPIATHKNKKDRARLYAMQDRLTRIHNNADRCRASVNARMSLRTRPMLAMAGHNGAFDGAGAFAGSGAFAATAHRGNLNGVMHTGEERDFVDGGRHNGVMHSAVERDVHHDSATYGRRHSSYGHRDVHVEVTHSHEHRY